MKLSNVANAVCEYVEKELKPPFPISIDLIPDDTPNAACLRHDPAPAAERRFGDGTRLVSWSMSFYVRNEVAKNARMYTLQITNKLDGATIKDAITGLQIECEATTIPQFISVDDKKLTTYSAGIKCEYLETNEA